MPLEEPRKGFGRDPSDRQGDKPCKDSLEGTRYAWPKGSEVTVGYAKEHHTEEKDQLALSTENRTRNNGFQLYGGRSGFKHMETLSEFPGRSLQMGQGLPGGSWISLLLDKTP